jgi:hypothetical protein
MSSIFRRVLYCLLLLAQADPTSAQVPGYVKFDVGQYAEPDGSVTYALRASSPGGAGHPTLIAPDGTQFHSSADIQTAASFAELGQRFFGDWIIVEPLLESQGGQSQYSFSVAPFYLNDLFHETPLVTTPTNGTFVPHIFDIEWEYPSGAIPRPFSKFLQSGGNISYTPRFAPHPNLSVQVEVDISAPSNGVFNFRVGSYESLDDYVSDVVLLSGPDRTTFTIESIFRNYSVSTEVTVISAPGDFDEDGDVDGRDFLVWQRGGSSIPLSADDLAIWQAEYGPNEGLTTARAAVPEPLTFNLFAIAALALIVRRPSIPGD